MVCYDKRLVVGEVCNRGKIMLGRSIYSESIYSESRFDKCSLSNRLAVCSLVRSLPPLLCIRLTCIDELTRYVVFFNESNYAVEGIDRRSAKSLAEEHREKDAEREGGSRGEGGVWVRSLFHPRLAPGFHPDKAFD